MDRGRDVKLRWRYMYSVQFTVYDGKNWRFNDKTQKLDNVKIPNLFFYNGSLSKLGCFSQKKMIPEFHKAKMCLETWVSSLAPYHEVILIPLAP